MMNTHSQGVILFFNKQDWGTNLKFEMSNEPYFEIFINAFSKHHEFILWQIIDGFEWRWCTFFKINCAIIWSMLWHGVNILLLKHILVYFVWKKISYWCDSTSGLGKHKSRIHLFIYHMHKKPLLPRTTIWNTWVFMYHQRFSYVWNFGCIYFMFFFECMIFAKHVGVEIFTF